MTGPAPISYWIGFHVMLAAMLIAELTGSRAESTSIRRAALWMTGWIGVAACFALFVWHAMGTAAATQFTTGYILEESLSADNLFVFLMLFGLFQIEQQRRRTVLFWGVIGAVLMRGLFVMTGLHLLERFDWMRIFFAAIILLAAVRLLFPTHNKTAPRWLLWLQRWHPVSLRQDAFFVTENGTGMVTVLLLALVAIELADVVFALDSIPAVLSVTRHPFLAYTSNIMAVMGLRSLYFVLAGALERLRLLHYGLAAILAFVAARMALPAAAALSTGVSLLIILALMSATVAASLMLPKKPGYIST